MKANKKFVEETEAVSAVIGVILMVAITVAIAATVYVYVSGIASSPEDDTENASVTGSGTDDQIKLILAHGGENYDSASGYAAANVRAYVDGYLVSGMKTWLTGGQQLIGGSGTTWLVGSTCAATDYQVTVSIRDTVVFDGTVTVG